MRSKDSDVLASMLTAMEGRLVTELGTVKTQMNEVKVQMGEVKTDIARISANQEAAKDTHLAFRTELLGEGGRVFELERRQKSHETWQNVKFLVVLPVTLALHKAASAIGFKL